MTEPFWLTRQMVVAIHDEQLTIHGGASGLRDEGMLESALDRPKNRWSYEQAELAELAAAYAFGIARNHPFVDGNKRTGFAIGIAFLELNGLVFEGSEEDATRAVRALAANDLDGGAKVFGDRLGRLQHLRHREHRGQRRAQFVAEHCEKLVLGQIRARFFLKLEVGLLQLGSE